MAEGEMKRSRIVIDLVPIRPGVGGSGSGIWTHARHLVQELDRLDLQDLEIHCLITPSHRPFFAELRNIHLHEFKELGQGILPRLLWIHARLPLICGRLKAKVLHKLATETPLFLAARRVTTVHDFFNEFMQEEQQVSTGAAGRYFAWMTRVGFRKSRTVITVSEAMRDEALVRYPGATEVVAIHNGVDLPKPHRSTPNKEGSSPFTILYVAKFMPYKGQQQAVDAFERLLTQWPQLVGKARLVMHGFSNDEAYYEGLQQRIGTGVLAGSVEIRPYDRSKSIEEIYAEANLFLFLTRYEGFGLPVVEAQALDIPVICSDIPVLREVGGEGAWYVNPDQAEAVAIDLERIIRDPQERDALVEAGRTNIKRFSWTKMAKATAEVYRNASR
ncbi:MAG: glycosyltransferase family 1 protein [Flavobacteriales bacterium]